MKQILLVEDDRVRKNRTAQNTPSGGAVFILRFPKQSVL